jgi:hypothetical protein
MRKARLYLIVLLFILSGCTPKEVVLPDLPDLGKPAFIPFEEPHGIVDTPDSATRWFINNLTITNKYENNETTTDGVVIYWNYQIYDGLINETVENIINQKVAEKIEEYKKYVDFKLIPTYEGMYVLYPPETTKVTIVNISAYSNFNYNNILSIGIYVHITTNMHKDDGSPYDALGDSTVFNFDLNTGEEIHLSDLFVNGSNYVQVLNELVLLEALSSQDPDHYGNINDMYKGGFTGIRGDVTFRPYYSGLSLCFNENYNEFKGSPCILIPFEKLGSILALDRRFMITDSSLFTDKTVGKQVNYLYINNTSSETETRNGVKITKTITRDEELSASFIKLRDKLLKQGESTIDKMILTNIEGLHYTFSAIPVGPYMTVKTNIMTEGMDAGKIRTVKTYKQDGSVIGYADIFKPGVDYRTILKNELTKYIEGNYFVETYNLDDVLDSLQIELTAYGFTRGVYLSNFDFTGPAVGINEGDFGLTLNLDDYKDVMILEKWLD